jgi:hypothetical protein
MRTLRRCGRLQDGPARRSGAVAGCRSTDAMPHLNTARQLGGDSFHSAQSPPVSQADAHLGGYAVLMD